MAAGDPRMHPLALDIYRVARQRGKTALQIELLIGTPLGRDMEALYQKTIASRVFPGEQ